MVINLLTFKNYCMKYISNKYCPLCLTKKLTAYLFCLVTLIACSTKQETVKEEPKEISETEITLTSAQLKNAAIQTASLGTAMISNVLKVNGKIDVPPQNLVTISAPLGGYLNSTKLLPGLPVSKGEIIAVLKDQQYVQLQQDYLITKSKLQYAELEYNRQKELNASQASSDKITQQAQAEFNNLSILKNALAQKLKMVNIQPDKLNANNIQQAINIYSPINGYVSKVNVNIGKYVSPSEVLFELINPDDIHLAIKVFEKDMAYLTKGQRVIAYSNANPSKKYACEIILVSKNVTVEGTNEVHCHFEQYDNTLIPGLYMNAEIELQRKKANTLPEESIVSFEGKDFVFLQDSSHRFLLKQVTVGNTENGFTEIKNFAEIANKTIVVKGAYTLLMAMKNKEEEE